MKILHIVPSYKPAYHYGGPIESVAKLCEGLCAAGHEVQVLTTTANGPTELDIAPGTSRIVDGVNVTYFRRLTKDHTHVSPQLWKYLYRHGKEFDVIHIHSWWNFLVLVSAFICYLQGFKVVVAPRGMLSDYTLKSKNALFKKALHHFGGSQLLSKSYLHATSEPEYEECRHLIRGWKGFVVPNILRLPDIPIVKIQNDVYTVLFLGRVDPKKGLELLFEVISEFGQNIVLKIAGSGSQQYIAELKQQAQNLGIASKVQWLGWLSREEKFVELMNADLYALISHNEKHIFKYSFYVFACDLIENNQNLINLSSKFSF